MGNIFGKNPVNLAVSALTQVHWGSCEIKAILAMVQGTSAAFLQLWDLGRLPVLGTDTATWVFEFPGGTANQATTPPLIFPAGLDFNNGLVYMVGAASNSTTAAAANTLAGTIDWRVI